MLTLGSLFDGIGGWQLAAAHNGVTPIWSSEIEPFPCAVTKKHFPDTLQLGDITKLDGAELPPVDIICAGSPCQDLSVAGKQEGLKGARSGLFIRAVDIVRSMRRATGGKYPRYFVWENVPGAFSSNKGMDFRAVLQEITEAEIPMPKGGKWADAGVVEWDGGSLAWRILDAQYWGVPQRRRRIFLIADFTGHSAGQVLFEQQGLYGHIAESGEAREGTAAGTESGACGASVVRMRAGCAGGGKGALVSRERSLTLAANTNDQVLFVGVGVDNGIAGTLDASYYKGQGERQGTERTAVAVYENHGQDSRIKGPLKTAPAINAKAGTGGNNLPLVSYCVGNGQLDQARLSDKVGALNCMHDQQAVVVAAVDCRNGRETPESGTLQLKSSGGYSLNYQNPVRVQRTVRRLTPLECERLQGLEDGYTLIDDKTCSDTARYKALGNGMAQPCADYVIRRIVEVCDAT